MIPANKNPLLDSFFYLYCRWLLRRNFSGIYIKGLENYSKLDRARPAICFANHTNWWDGFLTFYLTRFNSHKATFCMMEEKQLKYYRFFTWLGMYSVDTSNPLRAAASVRYTIQLLQNPESLCWIFPQGKTTSIYSPIEVKEGTAYLANNVSRAQLLPVIFRYEFLKEEKPFVLIQIGNPMEKSRTITDEDISHALTREQESLEAALRNQNLVGFIPLIPSRLSLNKRWEWMQLAFKGRLREFKRTND